jgi:endonuclease/exonuclease/phosphatase family metal-dependent hydrolase
VKLSSVRRALAALAMAGLVAAPLVVSAPADAGKPGRPGNPPAKPVTVMTRNLYLGADINRPVNAALAAQAAGGSDQQILGALANATHVTRAIVDATDFTVRAKLLADEIAATEPDLIGLQEVAWWRHGPLQLERVNVGVPNAETTDYDFLEILLDALAARGVAYEAVSVAPRADVEAPSFTGAGSPDARDIRLTMRDVVLMHVEDGLSVLDEGQAVYAHNLQVPLLGNTISFDRGYQWVDVRAGAQRFRFVNSHFEAFSSDIAYAQAAQLLAEATAKDTTTVFVCDCNSDPLNSSIKPQDTRPHKAAYELITGAGGFTDEWLRWAPAAEGWTSGLSETVDDATGDDFDHRIDMVFARTATGGALAVDRGRVTGTDVSTKDPATGLWPSDHGGVVLRLRGL